MTSQTARNDTAHPPESEAHGPIAAAVSASAEDLAPQKRCLESALTDASLFGQLAYRAFCDLGFDRSDPPILNREDGELVYWAMSQLGWMINEAKHAFYEENARKRGPS